LSNKTIQTSGLEKDISGIFLTFFKQILSIDQLFY